MEFQGRTLIPAPPQKVWTALNDPQVLRQCIPGCDRFDRTDATHFSAAASVKLGPAKVTFNAVIALEDLDPPHRCTLKGEGQGGVAGSARGEAEILLTPEDGGTTLTYTAQAHVGGKLAQIGQRMIDGAAKHVTDAFFARFVAALGNIPDSVVETVAPEPMTPPAPAHIAEAPVEKREGLAPAIWVTGLIVFIAALLFLFGAVFDR